MRMDNETYRLRVENLFASVRPEEEEALDPTVMAELTRLAAAPRKARHFLKVVASQKDPELQEHFYRLVFAAAKSEADAGDLERHIRYMFYEDREHAKAILARIATREVLPALFRVISMTEEGWLAGELIRIVLSAPVDELYQPLKDALESKDYLLQCLAIYLIGKSGEDPLLSLLAQFYRRPVGEKIDRLEKKSLDALTEGMKSASDELIVKWLKDKSARIRELGLTAVLNRKLVAAVGDLISLILIDPRTRGRAAQIVLQLESEGLTQLVPGGAGADPVEKMVKAANQEPLQGILRSLMRDENPSVREVAVKLTLFLADPKACAATVRRLAVEERTSAVQIAALKVLAEIDHERLLPALVEVFTDTSLAGVGGREVVEAASQIMKERLSDDEVKQVEEGVRAKEQRRDAALDLFAGEVEWWRHDI